MEERLKPITIGKSEAGPVTLDIPRLIVSRLLVSADSGGGKSYILRKIMEEVSKTTQTIVIDPEGEFASLREIRDMVLVGPDGEVPADPLSAGVLCRKLMEMNLSAVVDLSELTPARRQEWVRVFCETMVSLPRALWHPCFVFVDEIHEFAGEGEKSASEEALAMLSSKGRKRGYCLAGATQRVSKLSKNVAAGLKNQLLGSFSLDIDIKRAAGSLGFDSKRWPEIRDLSSRVGHEGEFFGFGPAFNHRGVMKMRGGQVSTTHPEAGHGKPSRPPEPSAKIKGVLSELTDLSKLAQEEAKTLADAKRQIRELQLQLKATGMPKTIEVAGKRELQIIQNLRKGLEEAMKVIASITAKGFEKTTVSPELIEQAIKGAAAQIVKMVEADQAKKGVEFEKLKKDANALLLKLQKLLGQDVTVDMKVEHRDPIVMQLGSSPVPAVDDSIVAEGLNGPEQKVLNSLAFWESIGVASPNNSATALKCGYSPSSKAYQNPRSSLRTKSLIKFSKVDHLELTGDGRSKATFPTEPADRETLHRALMEPLDGPERKLLGVLIKNYPTPTSNEDLASACGYASTSKAYQNPRSALRSIGLAEFQDGGVVATSILFPEALS